MKPCDCKSMDDVMKMPESGICFNNDSISIVPPNVILKIPGVKFKISMENFKQIAEWYLEDQVEVAR